MKDFAEKWRISSAPDRTSNRLPPLNFPGAALRRNGGLWDHSNCASLPILQVRRRRGFHAGRFLPAYPFSGASRGPAGHQGNHQVVLAHALNALRNEYRSFGVSFDVVHHTALLAELLDAGAIEMGPDKAVRATYHDPCYLGRYNGEFDAPRRLIAASGYQLVEMGRSRENSFCCGAGGGRIWAGDEGVLERPSENRIKEALALGDISVFVVACPKDKVMYSAAVDALGAKDRLRVLDVVELIG